MGSRASPVTWWICACALGLTMASGRSALGAAACTPINPTQLGQTLMLSGHDLSTDDIVRVARYGAKVELSAAARDR